MFSASRRARARRNAQPRDERSNARNHFVEIAERCRQGIQNANNAVASFVQDSYRTAALALGDHSLIPTSQPLAASSTVPTRALFASVSSTNSNADNVAILPSKSRARKPAKAGGGPLGGGVDASTSSSPSDPFSAGSDPKKGGEKDEEEEERILISEIDVSGADGQLREAVLAALTTRPNFAYTIREVQEDMQRVFDTGYFSSCSPKAEDTRDGVRLTVEVNPNPELRGVVTTGAMSLPQSEIQDAFQGMRGRTLNYNDLTRAVSKLNSWYEKHGILGQVVDVELSQGDVAQIKVAEAHVNRIALRYVDPKTGESREEGKTRPEIVLRHLTTKEGQVYNLQQAKKDIEAVYSMGLFEDVAISPQPSEGSTLDAPRVDLTLELKEKKKTGGLAAGGGINAQGTSESSLPGFVGTLSYSQRNLFGLGQRLVASAEVGQLDSTFRVAHTDPWVRGDAYRTSRTISAQNTKVSAAPVHGHAADEAPELSAGGAGAAGAGDGVFVTRLIGGVEYSRPLDLGWQGSLGLSWQRSKCVDDKNVVKEHDMYGCPLMLNRGRDGKDTMALGTIRVAYTAPSGDAELVASMEQAVPLQRDWLNFNRFTLRADKSLPLGPLRLWVSGKGGAIIGDLPPYEAFPIGGTNSVRGYSEGGVGSGRNYVSGTVELHFPLIAPLQGSIFADYGSDLGSGSTVPGDPAGTRQKPGSGFGGGGGVRFDTPIGPLRVEYAMNDLKMRRFHLGIGSHG